MQISPTMSVGQVLHKKLVAAIAGLLDNKKIVVHSMIMEKGIVMET